MARAMVAVVFGVAVSARGAEVGYYSQPALYGERLVFVSEEDLWTAQVPAAPDAQTIIAHRLTSSAGSESRPAFSPDGQLLAFTAEYDGNQDVYVMASSGGRPQRLTFHPAADVCLVWTSDGRSVLFRSARSHPLGRDELYRISAQGGMPEGYAFGECSMISPSPTGRRFAFTRWSSESWSWKRYRGGAAPEVWVGDFNTGSFQNLTNDRSADQFPMWMLGRVFFLSDRTGTANIFSMTPEGADLTQHTQFAPVAGDAAAIEGYDVRWPARDEQRGATRLVFCQGGGLVLLDVSASSLRRLDVRLASDRVAARQRYASPAKTLTEFALSPEGDRLLAGARGELLCVDIETRTALQLTRSSGAREFGATFAADDQVLMVSDLGGEQQLAAGPADGSRPPALLTQDLSAWLFPPQTSPDGRSIALADKTMRLHVIDAPTLIRKQVDASEAGEITDYRFSPDGQWLAYVKPLPNLSTEVRLHSLRTGRSFPVSDGLHSDRSPRWDPAGRYLYMLSDRHLDPVLGAFDFEHVFLEATVIVAVPLATATPPPDRQMAHAAGFDLEAWAKTPQKEDEEAEDAPDAEEAPPGPAPIVIDTDGLPARHFVLPIESGQYESLEAIRGGVIYLARPVEGLREEEENDEGSASLGRRNARLVRHNLLEEKSEVIAEGLAAYALSADGSTLAWPAGEATFAIRDLGEDAEEARTLDLNDVRLRVDTPAEWRQIFEEAWRLQRDFYWADNFGGADWDAMKAKHAALLPRVGTRAELNDLIGEMIGELGTSHTYIFGGEGHATAVAVPVGLLGADIVHDGAGFKIARIIPGRSWGEEYRSPLGMAHLGVRAGQYLTAIDGVPLAPAGNVYDLLQDRADKVVRLTIADDAGGRGAKTVAVRTIKSERSIRYAQWIEDNRAFVAKASDGRIGYVHIPDMGGEGLSLFGRLFYPQFDRPALVIDVRDNGGGFVSQMILARLARRPIAFDSPRHGATGRYPMRAPHAHMVVLIDEHAGSDGDIFPAAFRALGLGPLIGTRTWGGVVGIRGDKPFVDLGLSTQPEFAWWDAKAGWSIENEGVAPDIEVPITPADRAAGRDSQLERAVRELLDKLQADPRDLPPRPPLPVRRGR